MEAAALAAGAVLNAGMEPDRQHGSQTLFCFLVMLMEGRALTHFRELQDRRGPRIVAQSLGEPTKPKAGTRAAGLLVKIPTAEFDVREFLNRLEKWEHMIKQDAAIVEELESRAGTGHVKDGWFAKRRPVSAWHWQGQVWSRSRRQGQGQEQRRQGTAGVLQVGEDRPHEEGLPQRQAQRWTLPCVSCTGRACKGSWRPAVEHMGNNVLKDI